MPFVIDDRLHPLPPNLKDVRGAVSAYPDASRLERLPQDRQMCPRWEIQPLPNSAICVRVAHAGTAAPVSGM